MLSALAKGHVRSMTAVCRLGFIGLSSYCVHDVTYPSMVKPTFHGLCNRECEFREEVERHGNRG